MKTNYISPRTHGTLDYTLAGSLLLLPSVFGLPKKVKRIYAVEAMLLLGYIAISDVPGGLKPLIPYKTHGKIDHINIAHFAIQNTLKPFRKNKKSLVFNMLFTLVAGIVVTLTDWEAKTRY